MLISYLKTTGWKGGEHITMNIRRITIEDKRTDMEHRQTSKHKKKQNKALNMRTAKQTRTKQDRISQD